MGHSRPLRPIWCWLATYSMRAKRAMRQHLRGARGVLIVATLAFTAVHADQDLRGAVASW
jgi:hypothetical protein